MASIAQRLVRAMVGRDRPSALDTDAYKNSMAQAGYPLRLETFYMTFRRGKGPWFNPFDLVEIIELLRPELPDLKERGFLQTWGYGLTPAMEQALRAPMEIVAIPQGWWFGAREPVVAIRSASYLVSWYEPLTLMLHYPIQIATAIKRGNVPDRYRATCQSEAEIISLVYEAMGVERPPIDICVREYRERVSANANSVYKALSGEPERAFEVGFRAATCIEQHRLALKSCRRRGIVKTSNLRLAYELNLQPVGTTGHEHQMRHKTDLAGFRAIRDCRPETPSYLFDTDDPILIGIPAIRLVVFDNPKARCSFRFDSGDQDRQFEMLWGFASNFAPEAAFIFEDGYTANKTITNESFLKSYNFPREQAWYGYGGYLVSAPAFSEFTRDTVSAAYKLSATSGDPVMKFSGSPGKESTPGHPRSFIRIVPKTEEGLTRFDRLIGQWGEIAPDGFVPLTDNVGDLYEEPETVGNSPETEKLIVRLTDIREEKIAAAKAA